VLQRSLETRLATRGERSSAIGGGGRQRRRCGQEGNESDSGQSRMHGTFLLVSVPTSHGKGSRSIGVCRFG
jgi:hypothetical protein